MAAILALVLGDTERARIRHALLGVASVRFCDSVRDLVQGAEVDDVDAAIVELHDASGAPTLQAIRLLRERYPSIAVLAYVVVTAGALRETAEAGALGVRGVIVHDVDDYGSPLRRIVAAARGAGAAEQIARAAEPAAPDALRPFIRLCAASATRPFSVEDAARALGVHRRTLVNRLRAAGLPPPREIVAWNRLLHATRLLDDPGRALDRIASDLGFASASSLYNMLRRYTGLAPSALRARGAFRHALAGYVAALSAGRRRGTDPD